ncbi:hypothetical protein OL229_13210 [Neisseriaceae bacterium JH1-16]|nr:hypothetical protein [Neisseriaceae bacterium JH1-16]
MTMMPSGASWPSRASSNIGVKGRRLAGVLGCAALLYAWQRWGRLPLATPGYQGLPMMALLAWNTRGQAGRDGTPLAALLAGAALWLGGPVAPIKAMALPVLAGSYALLAGPVSAKRWRAVAAGAVYAGWPLLAGAAKALGGGMGMTALLVAHAGFGLLGAALGVLLQRCSTVT